MPASVLIPDIEKLTVAYLRADSGVAAMVGTEVSTRLPNPLVLPRVRLTRVGGVADDPVGYLDRPNLQVEAWAALGVGDDKAEAFALAAATLRALLLMPTAIHAGAVITDVTQNLGLRWFPDPSTDTPRYLFGVTVTAHGA